MSGIFDQTVWSAVPSRLAILVPARDTVYTVFAQCLTELVKTTTAAGHEVFTIFDTSTILPNQRENLANQALDIGADWVLWLDSDMAFPSTTAIRLMSHDVPVVACNYMKRSLPLTTVAYPNRGDWDNWLPLESQDGLEPVEGVGMGCFLMRTNVLLSIEPPYFGFDYQDGTWHGEDFWFQQKLQEAGHKILIDQNLSRQIRHIGQWAFGPSIGTNEEQIIKRAQRKNAK